MFNFKSVARTPFVVLALSAALALATSTAGSQPSQSPLLSRDGGGVSPNLILDVDDSGSMAYQHMPEENFVLSGKTIKIGGNVSVLTHPNDTTRFAPNWTGVWTADIGSTEVYQRQARSPDVNTMYYNPATTYKPWIQKDSAPKKCGLSDSYCDTSRFPNANLAAAQFNPIVASVPAVAGPGPISYVGSGAISFSATGNINPGLPLGLLTGDLLMCFSESKDRRPHTTPAGWTQSYGLRGDTSGPATHSASMIYKIAAAVESAPSIGRTGTPISMMVGQCSAFRNVDPTSPFDTGSSTTNDLVVDTSIAAASITTSTSNAMVLFAAHHSRAGVTFSVPSGFSFAAGGGAGTSSEGASIGLFRMVKAVAGATGAATSNVGIGFPGRNSGALLALRQFLGTPLVGGANLSAPPSDISAQWCTTSSTTCAVATRNYTPMLFYRLKKDGDGKYLDPTVSSNYDTYDLTLNQFNGAGVATGTYPTRTDCATGGVCDISQERQNYANWFVYHRSRMLLARASVAEAFWSIKEDKLRVGWGYINKPATTVDGEIGTRIVVTGVRDFSNTRKDDLFSFIRTLTPNGSTPLQEAMIGVGNYYKTAGPWADNPADLSIGKPKDCRRAYHMLITDGLWNGTPSFSVGNYDNLTATGAYTKITSSGADYIYAPKPPFADSNVNYLADYALYYFAQDLRPDTTVATTLANNVVPTPPGKLFWQGMVNFMVGIGLTGSLDPSKDLAALSLPVTDPLHKPWPSNKVDDLWHAAVNSEGRFFTAKNSNELAVALTSALNTTQSTDIQEAGVATSASVLESNNRKYIPTYKRGSWSGDVRALVLGADGLTTDSSGASGIASGEIWLASKKLPLWSDRNIYTWSTDSAAPTTFTWAAMGATNQLAIGPDAGSANLVDYLRGSKQYEVVVSPETTNRYRPRESILGDFINSNPLLVKSGADLGYGGLTLGGSGYNAFRTTKGLRNGMLFVGSNGGMLHAFKDTLATTPTPEDGKEVFAYVPRAVYPKLSMLSNKSYGSDLTDPVNYHQFFVDGALSESDAFVKATAGSATAEWRNYVTGSLGSGGRAVFALDVTNMTAPGADNIKWEFSDANDSDLGFVSTPIEVGVLKDDTWVAIFGNGAMSSAGKAALFVVNLETGAAQKLVVESSSGTNGLGGVGLQRDANGYIENIYAGDLNGAMWKFAYNAAESSKFEIANSGSPLINAISASSVAQPITQAPSIFDHSLGGKIVVFGTGRLFNDIDRASSEIQSMYGVWDKPSDTILKPFSRSLLEPRELEKLVEKAGTFYGLKPGDDIDWATQRGWVIDLYTAPIETTTPITPNALLGERIIYPPQRINSKLVLFSAVAPAGAAEVCSTAEGNGANFIIPVETGKNPTYKLFDTDGKNGFDEADVFSVGYATKVDGIDKVLTGSSTDPKCPDGTILSIQNTVGQLQACVKNDPPSGKLQDRIWRRIINPPIR